VIDRSGTTVTTIPASALETSGGIGNPSWQRLAP
jgi:hypothetical protein